MNAEMDISKNQWRSTGGKSGGSCNQSKCSAAKLCIVIGQTYRIEKNLLLLNARPVRKGNSSTQAA